ncbi:MAG TPA: hypothetical protein VIJ25_06360 [Methylococcales bacterium]
MIRVQATGGGPDMEEGGKDSNAQVTVEFVNWVWVMGVLNKVGYSTATALQSARLKTAIFPHFLPRNTAVNSTADVRD